MNINRALAGVGALVALLVLTVVVAAASDRSAGPPAAGRPAPSDRPAPSEQPARLDDDAALRQARALLIRDCMRRRGFDDYPTPNETAFPREPAAPYGRFDVGWARAHGYGSDIQAQVRTLSGVDPVRAYFERLPESRRGAALRAVNGASPTGLEAVLPGGGVLRRSADSCTSVAEDRLYGNVRAWYRASKIVESLDAMQASQVLRDRRYRRAVAKWSRCMRRSEHPARTPSAAQSIGLSAGDRRVEIATAVAEAACARRTGLARTTRALDRSSRRATRSRWRPIFEAHARMVRRAVPRARAIVARG